MILLWYDHIFWCLLFGFLYLPARPYQQLKCYVTHNMWLSLKLRTVVLIKPCLCHWKCYVTHNMWFSSKYTYILFLTVLSENVVYIYMWLSSKWCKFEEKKKFSISFNTEIVYVLWELNVALFYSLFLFSFTWLTSSFGFSVLYASSILRIYASIISSYNLFLFLKVFLNIHHPHCTCHSFTIHLINKSDLIIADIILKYIFTFLLL